MLREPGAGLGVKDLLVLKIERESGCLYRSGAIYEDCTLSQKIPLQRLKLNLPQLQLRDPWQHQT